MQYVIPVHISSLIMFSGHLKQGLKKKDFENLFVITFPFYCLLGKSASNHES